MNVFKPGRFSVKKACSTVTVPPASNPPSRRNKAKKGATQKNGSDSYNDSTDDNKSDGEAFEEIENSLSNLTPSGGGAKKNSKNNDIASRPIVILNYCCSATVGIAATRKRPLSVLLIVLTIFGLLLLVTPSSTLSLSSSLPHPTSTINEATLEGSSSNGKRAVEFPEDKRRILLKDGPRSGGRGEGRAPPATSEQKADIDFTQETPTRKAKTKRELLREEREKAAREAAREYKEKESAFYSRNSQSPHHSWGESNKEIGGSMKGEGNGDHTTPSLLFSSPSSSTVSTLRKSEQEREGEEEGGKSAIDDNEGQGGGHVQPKESSSSSLSEAGRRRKDTSGAKAKGHLSDIVRSLLAGSASRRYANMMVVDTRGNINNKEEEEDTIPLLWQCPTGLNSHHDKGNNGGKKDKNEGVEKKNKAKEGDTDDDEFRSAFAHVKGEPQHVQCGVLISNMCLKNSRPLVFVDERTTAPTRAIPKTPPLTSSSNGALLLPNGAWALESDELEYIRQQQKQEQSQSRETFTSPFQLTAAGSLVLCNEAVKGKARFQMREYYPHAYRTLVAPTLRQARLEWFKKGMLPLLSIVEQEDSPATERDGKSQNGQKSAQLTFFNTSRYVRHYELLPYKELSSSGRSASSSLHTTDDQCSGKILVAPFCWELYGYHLLLCIMTTHAHLSRLGLLLPPPAVATAATEGNSAENGVQQNTLQKQLRVVIAVSKASKQFPYMTGSSDSWGASVRYNVLPSASSFSSAADISSFEGKVVEASAVMPSRTHPSTYWRLWEVLTDSPADVFPDSDVPPQCFRLAVIGAPASFTVSNVEGRAFRLAVIERLRLPLRKLLPDTATTANKEVVAVEGGQKNNDEEERMRDHRGSSSARGDGSNHIIASSDDFLRLFKKPHDLYSSPIPRSASAGSAVDDRSSSSIGRTEAVGGLISCKQYRVVIIQREKSYQITNIDDLVAQVQCAFSDDDQPRQPRPQCKGGQPKGKGISASGALKTKLFSLHVVILEKLSLDEQLELAINTDLLIAVHGNGLTWTALMPPGGAVIELWPNYVYNANYQRFAERSELLKVNVEAGNSECKHRCPMAYQIPPAVLTKINDHLDRAACH